MQAGWWAEAHPTVSGISICAGRKAGLKIIAETEASNCPLALLPRPRRPTVPQ